MLKRLKKIFGYYYWYVWALLAAIIVTMNYTFFFGA